MAQADAARPRPGVFLTAGQAWRSTGQALLRMPLAFLLTMAALVLLGLASSRAGTLQHAVSGSVTSAPFSAAGSPISLAPVVAVLVFGLYVLRLLALAPLAVAVHRFVLLGERSPLLPLRPLERLLRFAGWLLVLGLLYSLPGVAVLLPSKLAAAIGAIALVIASMVVTTRLVLVFPAVAIGTARSSVALSWAATRWQFWRIVGVLLATTVPAQLLLVGVVLLIARSGPGTAITNLTVAMPLLDALFMAVVTALGAAAASWLFADYGLLPDA